MCKRVTRPATPYVAAVPAVTEMRVVENLLDMEKPTAINKQVGGGRGHRWKSVHKATLPSPTVVSKIKLSAQMKEQRWGGKSYGHVTVIGSYQGKRSWQKTIKHTNTGKRGSRQRYTSSSTNGFENVNYSKSPAQQIKCPHWGWGGGYHIPVSDGARQCGGVPTQGLTDKIEVWHQSRRGRGHSGYARNVSFKLE